MLGIGDDHRRRVSDMYHSVDGQRRAVGDVHVRAASVLEGAHAGDHRHAVGSVVSTRQYAVDPRHRRGRRVIDQQDFRMRMGQSQDDGPELAVGIDVGQVAALAYNNRGSSSRFKA